MIREMILLSKDNFPLADGKTEKIVHSPKQHPYNNWPSSRFRDEENPIAEITSTLSNRKQEMKTKRRKLPLKKSSVRMISGLGSVKGSGKLISNERL